MRIESYYIGDFSRPGKQAEEMSQIFLVLFDLFHAKKQKKIRKFSPYVLEKQNCGSSLMEKTCNSATKHTHIED